LYCGNTVAALEANAIGAGAKAGFAATAIGWGASASGSYSTAIGTFANASGWVRWH